MFPVLFTGYPPNEYPPPRGVTTWSDRRYGHGRSPGEVGISWRPTTSLWPRGCGREGLTILPTSVPHDDACWLESSLARLGTVSRTVQLTLLCEDRQQEAFLRRFFARMGWKGRMRVEKSPSGRGSGEQWVRERFPRELEGFRRSHVARALVAMIDADSATVSERINGFECACKAMDVEPRRSEERVALFIPRRNIETWIAYLEGSNVSEEASLRWSVPA